MLQDVIGSCVLIADDTFRCSSSAPTSNNFSLKYTCLERAYSFVSEESHLMTVFNVSTQDNWTYKKWLHHQWFKLVFLIHAQAERCIILIFFAIKSLYTFQSMSWSCSWSIDYSGDRSEAPNSSFSLTAPERSTRWMGDLCRDAHSWRRVSDEISWGNNNREGGWLTPGKSL